MPGGRRPGAGRKSGDAWAGKAPRDPAVRDMARERVREVLTTAQDPVAVLVEIANDKGHDVQVRVQAASAAAPYIFPRLSASVVATAPMASKDDHAGLIERIMGKLAAKAPPAVTLEHDAVAAGAD